MNSAAASSLALRPLRLLLLLLLLLLLPKELPPRIEGAGDKISDHFLVSGRRR
jgi:hypothetical protein